MKSFRLPYEKVPQLSGRDVAYHNQDASLRPFYKYPVAIESFKDVIADKSKEDIDRDLLVAVLKNQYTKYTSSEIAEKQIGSLQSANTFTVVTAHQPSLFTGPLYYIYKIISAINLSKQLNQQYPDHHIVPVFITGGEDHDFEEINHLHLFGNKLEWENDESGSVGMMSTSSLGPVLAQLKDILGDRETASHIYQLIEETHTRHSRYSDAAAELVHRLFADDGLLVLNMNEADLKRQFVPVIREEIIHQPSQALVEAESRQLTEVGFKQQATAREINFFYLTEQLRERIVFEDERYRVLNTDLSFNETEMIAEIEQHPERFSPNVVMRPLFQETILPNLAYIGGGGELAYWMERRTQFEHFGINFPMLIRRDSVLWIDAGNYKRMQKLDIGDEAIFEDTDSIIRQYVHDNAPEELDFSDHNKAFSKVYEQLAATAKKIDPTLSKTILAEQSKQLKNLEQLESRIVRAEKQKHEVSVNQIRGVKDKLFPGNSLQERRDNFLNLYTRYGDQFFEILKDKLDPLEKGFTVIIDDGQ